jgi:multidrug transporter EmrE-like cation transporter
LQETIAHVPHQALNRKAALLVLSATLLNAAAQISFKFGANKMATHSPWETVWAMITNLPLITGYSLLGGSTILMVLALRRGQLSILYPIMSLGYVWVTALSVIIFHEQMTIFKTLGLLTVMGGVAILGMDGRR